MGWGKPPAPKGQRSALAQKANQKKKPSTQEFLGDEEHVDVQTYALDSIEKIAVNGYTLTVEERDNAYAMR